MRNLFLFIVMTAAASAQMLKASSSIEIDFYRFIALVNKEHPEKNISNLSLDRKSVAQTKVGNLTDPEISFGREKVSLNPMNNEASEAMWQVTVKQMFPWPGSLAAEKYTAEANVKRAELDTKSLSLQRQIEAKSIYVSLVTAHKLLEIEKENLSLSDKILKNASSRLKYGVGNHHEAIQAQNENIILSSNINAEDADFENLKDYAAQLIGEDDSSDINFIFSLPAELTSSNGNFEDINKSQLEALQREATARLEAERKKSLPNFMISGSVMKNDTGMNQYSLMAGVSIPIFSDSIRQGVERETILTAQQSSEELAWHDKKKKLALTQLNRRRLAIESHLKSLQDEILPNFKQHLDSLSSEYAQGKADFNSINTARKSLLKYRKAQALTEQSLALTSIAFEKINYGLIDGELEQATPKIPSFDMTEGSDMGSNSMDMSSMPEKKDAPSSMKKKQNQMPEDEKEKKGSMGGM